MLKIVAERSEKVLCVCTGSALLARTGLLDGKEATSNKMAWDWVILQNHNVVLKRNARWVVDGKFYTSSGITAELTGIGVPGDTIVSGPLKNREHGYLWNRDKNRTSLHVISYSVFIIALIYDDEYRKNSCVGSRLS